MGAAIDSLPDELVKDILADVLVVPDDEFSKVGSASGFGRNLVSSSHTLLVSKRWLRVATPLLYECIVLRSTPQAQAFQDALRGKMGAQLKRFVRRMRLDGCFGAVVDKIFRALPGIKDLFLRLPSNSEERVNGVVTGLSKLRPTRVIFEFTGLSLWKNSYLMAEALCKALRNWDTLLTIKLHVFPFHYKPGTRDDEITRLIRIGEAISDAPHLCLAIVSFSEQDFTGSTSSLVIRFVKAIGKSSSLQTIHVLVDRQSTLDRVLDGLVGDPCARIAQCSLNFSSSTQQLPISHFDNMGQIPQLPEDIIRTIIGMDLRAHLARIALETNWTEAMKYKARCLTLFSVSKTFYKLTLPLAFRFIFIHSPRSLALTSQRILGDTVLLYAARTVKFSRLSQGNSDDSDDGECSHCVEDTASSVVKCLRNIRQISISTATVYALHGMATESKLGLKLLRLNLTELRVNQGFLTQFSNLTHLILKSDRFSTGVLNVVRDATHRPCFQNLVSVKIFDLWDMDVLHILQSCDFPSVRSIMITLSEHKVYSSTKLQSESLPSFPKLQYISIIGLLQEPYSQLLQAEQCTVEKIILSSGYIRRRHLQTESEHISRIFDSIDFSNLKALKELQMASVDEWPWQDRELKNSTWQKRAQSLVSSYNFKITDASGVPWKPRMLQRSKRKVT